MTPVEITLTIEQDGDHHVTLTGPEGYVCMDADAAAKAAETLHAHAEILRGVNQ